MMKRLTLFLIAVLAWGCSPDSTPFETNPVSSPSAKVAAVRDPFSGLDEQGHMDGVGSADTYRAYLQILTRRLALVLADESARNAIVMGIGKAEDQEANIAKLLASQPALLAKVAAGFKQDVDAASVDARLPNIIKGMSDQNALLSVSEALFGLEIRLIDENGSYRGHTPIDIFHDPVIDEKDVERYEGFDPEGSPTTMPFDMRDFVRTAPFFYVQQDEQFFRSPGNAITAVLDRPASPQSRPTLYAGLRPLLSLLVKPAYADDNIPSCYHDQSVYVTRFIFFDDHDPGSGADMYFKTRVSHPNIGSQWDEVTGWRYNWWDADEEDTEYPKSGQKYPEVLKHTGYSCKGQVFDSGNSLYDHEDDLTLQVLDEDPGWNPDDRIGQWRYIRTFENNGIHYLDADHYAAYSSPQDCEVYIFHAAPGGNYYKP